MSPVEAATAYAIAEIRAGRNITEATLHAQFPLLSSYGAPAAIRAAEDATSEPVQQARIRSGGTTFCTSDRAIAQRKLAEAMDRAAAGIPRAPYQAGRKR